MKKRYHRAPAAALLLTLYLLGLAFGLLAIVAYPICHRQKNGLIERARTIAEEYAQGVSETAEYVKSPTMRVVIYGMEKNGGTRPALRYSHAGAESNAAIHAYLEPYLPDVLDGGEVFAIAPSFETPKKLTQICLIAGVPVTEQGKAAGAVFLVRFLENLQEAYMAFVVYFTILYWTAAYIVVSYTRKKRRLEDAQQTYIANVTHALKSPLASVKAITETLSDVPDLDPDKRTYYYGMILREVNLQSHMVQEILELSKLQSRKSGPEKAAVDASSAFAPALEKVSVLCDCAKLSFHISEEIPRLPVLWTNGPCIGQVLEILLENAVKYVDSGGNIWLDAAQARGHAVFCVRDDGRGISKEDLPHVFERFYRCDGNARFSSGLGLAIAREVIDSLKEKIWVESEPGQGSAFYFTVKTK